MIAKGSSFRRGAVGERSPAKNTAIVSPVAASLRESIRRWMETEIEVVGPGRGGDEISFEAVWALVDAAPSPAPSSSSSRSVDAPYLTSMLRTELLTPTMEAELFHAMNDCKRQAVRLQKRLSLTKPRRKVVRDLERWMSAAVELRNRIVAANARLVVSVAKKFAGSRCSLTDLISDGNLTLMKAVEKFDVTRGFRFSTYATWALRYDFVRTIRRRNSAAAGLQPNEEGLDGLADTRDDEFDDRRREAGLRALEQMLGFLEPREHAIIERRFGLKPGSEECSLQEIAADLGICKERVRQLQLRALAKLRASAERFLPDECNAST